MKVITRFAPSPTGFLHIGGVRTALFNIIFAKKNNGKVILRIEDTDKIRSTKEYERSIIDSFKWFGFLFDENFKQSDREEVYKKYLKKLIEQNKAYISKETPKEEGDRDEVIRFKNPNKKIKFTDLIRGEIEFDTTELGDFIIAKSLKEPIYHLAVVIDDFEMGITHIIRGEEHISNTPRQILIQEAIGAVRPIYAHLPLILATDKSKLSKRKHGESVSINFYKEKGYLPEAIINYLALLGWNPGTEQEIFSMNELIKQFDFVKVQKSGAIFNIEKLNWINKEYLKKLDKKTLFNEVKIRIEKKYKCVDEYLEKLLPIILDRISIFSDIDTMIELGELDYFFNEPKYAKEKLFWKNENDSQKTIIYLRKIIEIISKIGDWKDDVIKTSIMSYAEKEGKGGVLWPVRYALSGKDKSPDPFTLIFVLGKEKTIARIENAINILS